MERKPSAKGAARMKTNLQEGGYVGEQDNLRTMHVVYEDSAAVVAALTAGPD